MKYLLSIVTFSILLCRCASGAALPSTLPAAPVTIAFDPSPDSTVVGYALYYGVVNAGPPVRMDLGASTTVQLKNLIASETYSFQVASYNASGTESVPSSAIYYAPPVLTPLKLTRLAGGRMQIKFRAPVYRQCRIEYASTLQSPRWWTLAESTADGNGNVTVADPLVGNPVTRFYRAVFVE